MDNHKDNHDHNHEHTHQHEHEHEHGAAESGGLSAGMLAGLLIGGLAGAIAMLLLAPQSGKRTRAKLRRQSYALRARRLKPWKIWKTRWKTLRQMPATRLTR